MANKTIDFNLNNQKSFSQWYNRVNPTPLDKSSVFESLAEAQEYAANNVIAYPGQIIAVVTENEVKVYKINNKALEEIGKGSQTVSYYSDALAAADGQYKGQIIYVENSQTADEYNATLPGAVKEGDLKNPDDESKGTYSSDEAIAYNKTLQGATTNNYASGPYIVTDDNKVEKLGTTTASGDLAADVAALQTAVGEKTDTASADGSAFAQIAYNRNFATNAYNYADSAYNYAGSAYSYAETVGARADEAYSYAETLGGKIDNINLVRDTTDTAYAAVYTFTKPDGTSVNINIPKDQFLDNAEFVAELPSDAVTDENGLVAGDPYLKFTWQYSANVSEADGTEDKGKAVTYVPVKDLVDTYTADGTYIKLSDNQFSLDIDAVKKKILGDVDVQDVTDLKNRVGNLETAVGVEKTTATENVILYKNAAVELIDDVDDSSTGTEESVLYYISDESGETVYAPARDLDKGIVYYKDKDLTEQAVEGTDYQLKDSTYDATGLYEYVDTAYTKAEAYTDQKFNTATAYSNTLGGKIDELNSFKDRSEGFATAAQGALADTAVQSISAGTDGSYFSTNVEYTGTSYTISGSVTTVKLADAVGLSYNEETGEWTAADGSVATDGLLTASDVAAEITADEEVIAQALTDHESRINSLETSNSSTAYLHATDAYNYAGNAYDYADNAYEYAGSAYSYADTLGSKIDELSSGSLTNINVNGVEGTVSNNVASVNVDGSKIEVGEMPSTNVTEITSTTYVNEAISYLYNTMLYYDIVTSDFPSLD